MSKSLIMSKKDWVRFKTKFSVAERPPCWIWTGGRQNGYGVTSIKGTSCFAHRVSYTNFKGNVPEGKLVRHTCNDRACVNPAHLILGTIADNARDKAESGIIKGTEHPNAKLNDEIVYFMRESFRTNRMTVIVLARKFKVSTKTVYDIINRKAWIHVLED